MGPFADPVSIDVDALSADGLFLPRADGVGQDELARRHLLRVVRRRAGHSVQAGAALGPRRCGCRPPRHARTPPRIVGACVVATGFIRPRSAVRAPYPCRPCDPGGAPRGPVAGHRDPQRRSGRRHQGRPRHGDETSSPRWCSCPRASSPPSCAPPRGPPRGAGAAVRRLDISAFSDVEGLARPGPPKDAREELDTARSALATGLARVEDVLAELGEPLTSTPDEPLPCDPAVGPLLTEVVREAGRTSDRDDGRLRRGLER